MTTRSIPTIDPGGAARRRGAEGQGIVIALMGSGIDARHPHFDRYENLVLEPPLHHCDLTLLRDDLSRIPLSSDAGTALLAKLDPELHNREALIDRYGHATHAAAIVAGYVESTQPGLDWSLEVPSMAGVAPRCKLLSLKVVDDEGVGNELDALLACELVMALNARAGRLAIHGVFIPMSLRHDVTNYACGRTPVCEAVDRLVESGVVVVAPSGNIGYRRFSTPSGDEEMAALMTITDPGNAERAITVGATHRDDPRSYGALYFSGRGPTLDGRDKPDLLAPGHRILSAVPVSEFRRKAGLTVLPGPRRAPYEVRDGTSMASAHVAGAVAVLLSARPDLIGRPDTVKETLLSTATDLGRPAWFQGRGLVNLSRALGDDALVEPRPATAETARQVAPAAPARPGGKRFAVAFSFPGEHRDYVKRVVFALREISDLNRSDIFYDKFYEAELSRPDLDVYLLDLYRQQSELVVVFLSADYEKKEWPGLEWRAVRELIKTREGHAVMPVRFDQTQIPGLLSIDGSISAEKREPEQIAEMIVDRLRSNRDRGLA